MFRTVEKHMDNRELARLIGEKLLNELRVPISSHIAFMRDSVKVNGCAVERLRNLCSSSEDILCICHTLCHVGEHFQLPTLSSFMHHWIGLVYLHAAAKATWKELIGGSVVGYSTTRWYSRAEIEIQLALNFGLLRTALDRFEEREYGDAHTRALRRIYNENNAQLELEFAAMLDQQRLVAATYALEGDRLEILAAYDTIEALRAYGRSLGEDGTLVNADAVMRKQVSIKKGTLIKKLWPGIGLCEAKVIEVIKDLESTLMPGKIVTGYKVKYASDEEVEDLEEAEVRKWLVIHDLPQRQGLVTGLKAGYEYLENRMTGKCDSRYDCSHMHTMLSLVRAFNPAFAVWQKIDAQWVDRMAEILPFAEDIDKLKADLSNYLAAAQGVAIADSSDVDAMTKDVLQWWKCNGRKCPNSANWQAATRKCFAMSPNSASCERVFSLLQCMFSPEQKRTLADQLQASLMLRYNGREVG